MIGRETARSPIVELGPEEQELVLEGRGDLFERGPVGRTAELGGLAADPGEGMRRPRAKHTVELPGVSPPEGRWQGVEAADIDRAAEGPVLVGKAEDVRDACVHVEPLAPRPLAGRLDRSLGEVDAARAQAGAREVEKVRSGPAPHVEDPRAGTEPALLDHPAHPGRGMGREPR